MESDLGRALVSGSAHSVLNVGHRMLGDDIGRLAPILDQALRGDARAVSDYVGSWRRLSERLLASVAEARPDLVARREGGYAVIDIHGEASRQGAALIERAAVDAPFSPLVLAYGVGDGVFLALVERLRSVLRNSPPLRAGARGGLPHWNADEAALGRFTKLAAMEAERSRSPVSRVAECFALSRSQLAGLFGVTRQAATRWLESGRVPDERMPKLLAMLETGELLQLYLRAGSVPLVARTRAPAYGGLSMLEMIAADRHQELLELTRRSFDWAASA